MSDYQPLNEDGVAAGAPLRIPPDAGALASFITENDDRSALPNSLRLIAGANVTLTANPAAGTLEVAAGGGGSGTLNLDFTGFAAPVTGAVRYVVLAGCVLLFVDAEISGTSNTTTLLMPSAGTPLPAELRPTVNRRVPVFGLIDNSVTPWAGAVEVNTAGGMAFFINTGAVQPNRYSSTGFTAANTKGLGAGASWLYPL